MCVYEDGVRLLVVEWVLDDCDVLWVLSLFGELVFGVVCCI